ncbi:DUF421 domain-containing protein [Alteromonas gracilis]
MEIVVRAAVVFFVLWALTRAVGRVTLGELSTFELLLYVTMGDLVQQSVTQQDMSMTGGLLAVSVFALLTVALHWTQWRLPGTRRWINGSPVVVVRDGLMVRAAARRERLTEDDLCAAARQQGIRDIALVELAVLEADGRISFFTRSPESDGSPETGSGG